MELEGLIVLAVFENQAPDSRPLGRRKIFWQTPKKFLSFFESRVRDMYICKSLVINPSVKWGIQREKNL
jgi:hypothetical protein